MPCLVSVLALGAFVRGLDTPSVGGLHGRTHRRTEPVAVFGGPRDDGVDDDDTPPFDEEDEAFLDSLEVSLRQAAAGRPPRPRGRTAALDRQRAIARSKRPEGKPSFLPTEKVLSVFDELREAYDTQTESPSQKFLLGALALLFGFYVSHGQLLGGGDQGGRWEYVSGAAATVVVERITRGYYNVPQRQRSPTLDLLNAFKVGFLYGIALDAIKFAG